MILNKFSFSYFKILNLGHAIFQPHLNFIIGNNGYGKTSLLEAIHCVLSAHSFYKTPDTQLVQYGQKYYQLETLVNQNGVFYKNYLYFNKETKEKKYLLDSKKVPHYQYLLSHFPLIYFTPFDIQILLGSPETRRQFFDRTLSYQIKSYYSTLKNYYKLIKEKNVILKKGQYSLLKTWNEQIFQQGSFLLEARLKHIENLNQALQENPFQPEWLKQGFQVQYKGFHNKIDFWEALEKHQNKEIEKKVSLVGPHRDDYLFYDLSYNRHLKDNLSLGQTKIFAFYLKFLELSLMNRHFDQKPLFLIDDVFSELDSIHKNEIIMLIQNLPNQILLTSTQENLSFYKMGDQYCLKINEKGFINY